MKNTMKLPRGAGSLQRRGRKIWMVYSTPEGSQIQENSGFENEAEALVLLLARSLATARVRAEMLESLYEEAQRRVKDNRPAEAGAGSKRRGAIVRRDISRRPATQGTTGGTR